MLFDCVEDLDAVFLGFEILVKNIRYFVTGADEWGANGGEIPLARGFRGAIAHTYHEGDSGWWLIN